MPDISEMIKVEQQKLSSLYADTEKHLSSSSGVQAKIELAKVEAYLILAKAVDRLATRTK